MSRQQDEACEILGHGHGPQNRLCHRNAGFGRKAGLATVHDVGLYAWAKLVRHPVVQPVTIGVRDRPRQAQTVSSNLRYKGKPNRFDIRERRHRS